MKVTTISKKKMNELDRIVFGQEVYNTESKIYTLDYKGNKKILKRFKSVTGTNLANKINTIELLNESREYLPSSFCIPDSIAVVSDEIIGFTIPYFKGINLSSVLIDRRISTKEQIYYLKRIGEILDQLKKIREYTPIRDIFINDLHDSNFIVNPYSKEIGVVDLDSCKIGNNIGSATRFLSRNSLLNNSNKYERFIKKDKQDNTLDYMLNDNNYIDKNYFAGHIIADENSDLYCYCIMILNYLYGKNTGNMKLEEFYDYVGYLRKIGISNELMDIICKIVIDCPNENPYKYLDELTNEQIYRAKANVYKKLG